MVQNRAVDEAVFNVTEAIRNAADAAIPKTSNSPRKLCKPWWNASCQQAKKEQRRAWGIFRRYPTTDNLIAFTPSGLNTLGILIGQRKGSFWGRVCGGRVACVVGDGSKERSAESGPRGRGTWLRMARRRGLLHIEKSSLASALDRARQHVMGVSPVSSFEESSGGYTGHSVKVAYLHCPVRPYIPNPLRCFQCQRFGHSKTTCRGQPTCARCAEILPNVVHRKGNYCLKNKNKISYPEARRIVSSRTPVSGISYAAITKKHTKTIAIQTDEPTTTTPSSPTPGKITAKPNFITVDTSKPVSTPPNVKKTRKTRIKESGVLANKKKRSNLSKNSMTWGRMSWKSMHPKVTKVYWMICRPNLRPLAPCEEQVRSLDALLYLLELPWSKNST
ncbi:putative RNA-directed DNA polymerase from transposon X-element [Trichonephila clavipes]|nr:putative RNA-directed DNA polymerase from transposon X-element [Trichonephila clavipes]